MSRYSINPNSIVHTKVQIELIKLMELLDTGMLSMGDVKRIRSNVIELIETDEDNIKDTPQKKPTYVVVKQGQYLTKIGGSYVFTDDINIAKIFEDKQIAENTASMFSFGKVHIKGE